MKTKQLFIGFAIGLIVTIVGAFLFLFFFTNYNLFVDFFAITQRGILGKVITLGAIPNIVFFLIFMNKRKDDIAKGILLATIFLTLITLLV